MYFSLQESTGLSVAMNKKQGVSGQSLAVSRDVNIVKHNKDFRSRTIIKEAIMENDFLKNLSQGQVGLPVFNTMKIISNHFTEKYFTTKLLSRVQSAVLIKQP